MNDHAYTNEETLVWEGCPSHYAEFFFYAFCILTSILILPLLFLILTIIKVNSTSWILTSQRLRQQRGWLNIHLDEIELYRFKSVSVRLPLFYRMFGLGSVVLLSSDKSVSEVVLWGVPYAEELAETIRELVEQAREVKGVREVDNAH